MNSEAIIRKHFACVGHPYCEAKDEDRVTHTRGCPAGLRERARRAVRDVLEAHEKAQRRRRRA